MNNDKVYEGKIGRIKSCDGRANKEQQQRPTMNRKAVDEVAGLSDAQKLDFASEFLSAK